MTTIPRTGLVTGASSGLGFETAAQLLEAGYEHVVATARTAAKALDTRRRLIDRTGREAVSALALDLDDLATVRAAVADLAADGRQLHTLVLNAGAPPLAQLERTTDGYETTAAASVIGHHLLTQLLLDAGLVGPAARVVISGSEAATGLVPTMTVVDLHAEADTAFGGDLEAAVRSRLTMSPPTRYDQSEVYATVKVFSAWWAAELADRLPDGSTANAVSPGSTPGTNMITKAPAHMRYLMVPLLRILPGMSHDVADGAARYLEVARGSETGKFFASRLRRMTGPLHEIDLPHITDRRASAALWRVLEHELASFRQPVLG